MERINPVDLRLADRQAIPNVCAWPNLSLLPDGTVLAAIFNQPCHGMWSGDLDGWVSSDRGKTWTLRATIAPHEAADENRMNCAVGLAADGDLVALCSGWGGRAPRGESRQFTDRSLVVKTRVYRSSDQGHSWEPGDYLDLDGIPFGDIHAVNGQLVTACYFHHEDTGFRSWLLKSDDDGHTWQKGALIADHGDETCVLPVDEHRWLASVRHNGIRLAISVDAGQVWAMDQVLTLPMQLTSHLTRLRDGTILLTYGNRNLNNYGVDARYSQDEGRTWSAPFRLADAPLRDCGYPSTVQVEDGELLTAYYTQLPGEYQYEMRAVNWCPFWA